jgi:hypothetical protein
VTLGDLEAPTVRGITDRLLYVIASMNKTIDQTEAAKGLVAIMGRLEPSQTARILGLALENETDASTRKVLAKGLAGVTGRLDPVEAARASEQLTRMVLQALNKETDPPWEGVLLANGLAAEVERLEASESAGVVAAQVAHLLNIVLEKELDGRKDYFFLEDLARHIAAVTDRLDPGEAQSRCLAGRPTC